MRNFRGTCVEGQISFYVMASSVTFVIEEHVEEVIAQFYCAGCGRIAEALLTDEEFRRLLAGTQRLVRPASNGHKPVGSMELAKA